MGAMMSQWKITEQRDEARVQRDKLLVALKKVTGSVIKSTVDRDGVWRAVREEAEALIAEIEASK
jgi:hypothetical protein